MGYRLSDIAVLYRTNMEPRLLMERLMEYNIPFQMRDALPNLYDHWITQDILAYIRIARDGAKRADVLRVINRPKRYVSRDALEGQVISWEAVKSWSQDKGWNGGADRAVGVRSADVGRLAPVAAVELLLQGGMPTTIYSGSMPNTAG